MMTTPEVRTQVVTDIEQAREMGARLKPACKLMGIADTTLRRWKPAGRVEVTQDQRPLVSRPDPRNKLTEQERQRILAVCNESKHSHLPPSQIVPCLADEGVYIASESSFYRVLKSENQLEHRGRAKRAKSRPATTHQARAANDVWMWDITYLPATIIGQHYYLYMIEDLYSRFGVHWEVHERESGELASQLIEQAVIRSDLAGQRPLLHSDNGSPMTCYTMKAKLDALGIKPSYSRPRVSNDNAFVESMFRTVKYCPQWPSQGFKSLQEARQWVAKFMRWYNEEHRHSGIRFVTPGQRYRGEDQQLLAQRAKVYHDAKEANPLRWSGDIRNWTPETVVALNPETKVALAA